MDATLDGFDWESVDRRFVPRSLRGVGVLPLEEDRERAVRSVLSALRGPVGPDGGNRGHGSVVGLGERLAALMAWAKVDVPVAVLASGHAHAEDLIGGGGSRYLRPDALWTVWLPEAASLRASVGGPVYHLHGVASRPMGGGITTHAVVAAESPDGTMLFAVDLRHPRVHVMADVAVAAGSPVEYSGAFRFEGVPATPLPRPVPPQDQLRRQLRLSSCGLVVGAAAAMADEVAAVDTSPVTADGGREEAVTALAARVLAAARAVEGDGTGRSLPWFDAEVADLAADIRAAAAGLLELGGRVNGHPGSRVTARAAQLELALRLEARVV